MLCGAVSEIWKRNKKGKLLRNFVDLRYPNLLISFVKWTVSLKMDD